MQAPGTDSPAVAAHDAKSREARELWVSPGKLPMQGTGHPDLPPRQHTDGCRKPRDSLRQLASDYIYSCKQLQTTGVCEGLKNPFAKRLSLVGS